MPFLAVGDDQEANWILQTDLIRSSNPFKWDTHPLVFINGCESGLPSSEVMGNLIQTFAGLGAAGVIGTEAEKVWEQLASRFAEKFFQALLGGEKVGKIIRNLRLDLLKINNPLGLIYTAYCSADLCLP